VAVLVTEACALPGITIPTIAAAANRGVVEVHIVALVVRGLVTLVADHARLVLSKEGGEAGEKEEVRKRER